jgi:hypothetical protein
LSAFLRYHDSHNDNSRKFGAWCLIIISIITGLANYFKPNSDNKMDTILSLLLFPTAISYGVVTLLYVEDAKFKDDYENLGTFTFAFATTVFGWKFINFLYNMRRSLRVRTESDNTAMGSSDVSPGTVMGSDIVSPGTQLLSDNLSPVTDMRSSDDSTGTSAGGRLLSPLSAYPFI